MSSGVENIRARQIFAQQDGLQIGADPACQIITKEPATLIRFAVSTDIKATPNADLESSSAGKS